MVGECYNEVRCCDYPVCRSVCSCALLDEPAIWQRAVLTHLRFVSRLDLYVDYVMFLTRSDLNFEPRVDGFHTGTYMWF